MDWETAVLTPLTPPDLIPLETVENLGTPPPRTGTDVFRHYVSASAYGATHMQDIGMWAFIQPDLDSPFPCRSTEPVRSEVRYLPRYLADDM